MGAGCFWKIKCEVSELIGFRALNDRAAGIANGDLGKTNRSSRRIASVVIHICGRTDDRCDGRAWLGHGETAANSVRIKTRGRVSVDRGFELCDGVALPGVAKAGAGDRVHMTVEFDGVGPSARNAERLGGENDTVIAGDTVSAETVFVDGKSGNMSRVWKASRGFVGAGFVGSAALELSRASATTRTADQNQGGQEDWNGDFSRIEHRILIGKIFLVIDQTGRGRLAIPMEKGFNSDISLAGVAYHVQTEDWGFENPWLVTRVFRSGAVIDSIKTPYSEVLRHRNAFVLLRNREAMSEALQDAMRDQHERVLRQLGIV